MAEGIEQEEQRGTGIDWPATFAGAGAAVTVALLLSTLGAAGTLIGAALGSVVATVSTALYKQGIESSRRRVAEVQAAALQREAARGHRHVEATEVEGVGDDAAPDPVAAPGNRWAALPWRRLALLAAVVFVIALVAISLIELLAGKSVSSITGGTDGKDRTSIGGVLGGDTDDSDKPRRTPTTDTATPTPTESVSPTEPTTAPTSEATPTESGTPTGTPSVTDTATPTEDQTATETPGPSDNVTP